MTQMRIRKPRPHQRNPIQPVSWSEGIIMMWSTLGIFSLTILAISNHDKVDGFPLSSSLSSSTSSLSASSPSFASSSSSSSPIPMTPSDSPWSPALWSLRLNFFANIQGDGDDNVNGKESIQLAVSGPVLVSSTDVAIAAATDKTINDDDTITATQLFFNGRTTVSEIRPITDTECAALLTMKRPDEDSASDDDDTDADAAEGQLQFQNPSSISMLNKSFKYINQNGEQQVDIMPGGWALDFPPTSNNKGTSSGKASTLRIWLDIVNDIERNQVRIPSNTRLFLQANVWRETDYEVGRRKIQPLQQAVMVAQEELNSQLSHDTGDRRLDGNDIGETLSAFGDMTGLIWKRDEAQRQLTEASQIYPNNDRLDEGPWPGDNEWLCISSQNPIFVYKYGQQQKLEEVQVIGSWSAEPILQEGEYEEVDD